MRKKKRRKFINRMKNRLSFGMLAALLVLGVMIGKLVYIYVTNGEKYEKQVLVQQSYVSTSIPYKRGDIVDTNGTVLATSVKVYTLIVEPKNVLTYEKNKKVTITALKTYFGLTDQEITEILSNPNSQYELVKKDLSYEEVKPYLDYIETSEGSLVTGVYFEERYVRLYPNNELACHLIGFNTQQGNTGGIEYSYSEELSGFNGRRYSYLDTQNNLTVETENAIDGYNVVSSLDANIQLIVEKKVQEYLAQENAKNISVLVMDPKTCNVLALYNSHSYNLNDPANILGIKYAYDKVDENGARVEMTDEEFLTYAETLPEEDISEKLNQLWGNFVVSHMFEPGSTFKTFTIAGALEEGVVTPSDTFFCDGFEKKDIYTIKCHSAERGGHGTLDLSGALENSCNDALMYIAEKEGPALFDKYQTLFGFGARTNIDLPGEESDEAWYGLIYHEDSLNITELATSSFGQSVNTTMVQLGTAFCSVINGGFYYKPTVVKRVEDSHGNIIDNLDKVLVRRTISEDVSTIMRDELFQVVERGTGKKAAVEGYTIGGKTGTAEKYPRGNGKYIISFIGFAPVDNPEVVIYVVVDEPSVADQSSSAASSYLFADIAAELFPYMNIYKTNDNYDIDFENAIDEPTSPIYEGETPENDLPRGATTEGETPTGETPAGETPAGETPTGETPTGETPAGEIPTGETPTGETPTGE